jgi:hypothetical protein
MKLSLTHDGRIHAEQSFEVPLSATAVWGQMRDYRRFLSLDPLHVRVEVAGQGRTPPKGDRLIIAHRLFGIGPDRVGRVLRWNEGHGYAISDLSTGGPRTGFPHVCSYSVAPVAAERSRITLGARGRWTARWVPGWAVRMWLWWVLSETEAHIRAELARLRSWRQRSAPKT